ncbi:MAG TPA: CotH kinase family protein, partial [Planctomycetota bacterium]|nr:CotH kinase family protein [Planctomycetota bacterium]
LYGALEHPDKRFLERNRLNPDGNLYKATASREETNGTYEKKTNENGDMTDLRTFLTALNTTPTPQLKAFFTDNVDADRVIDYQLAQTLTNNADYPHKNHYLYHDLERGRWMPLTWDMDLTFGKLWDGNFGGVLHDRMHNPGNSPWYTTNVDGAGGGNVFLDRFFSQAGDWFRRAYIVRLHDALLEKYTEEFFAEKIEGLRDILLDEQEEDIAVWGRSPATADDRMAPKEFDPNLLRVKEHIRLRRAFLINYLRTRSRFTGHDRLKITEVMYNPRGGDEDLEFLELWNPGETEINLTGWTIEGIGFAFPADYTLPAGGILVVSKNPTAFKAVFGDEIRVLGPYEGNLDNDGEILRVKDAGPGYPATVDFLRYGNDGDWPRGGDGLGYSIELSGASATRDNDMGSNWRQSFVIGGSPGTIQGLSPGSPLFRRGDPNADSRVNVSDAIAILLHLFAGADEMACMESADVDANGEIQSVDALLILSYLFQGSSGAAEIPSPGPSECLPAKPDQCRETNCRE